MSYSGQLNPEALWFRVSSLIGTGFFTGFFIANAVFFGRIISGTCNAVSRSEANGLMWINIILAIVAGAIFIWSFIRLFFHPTTRQELVPPPKESRVKEGQKPGVTSGAGLGRPTRTSPTAASDIVSPTTQQEVKAISLINV